MQSRARPLNEQRRLTALRSHVAMQRRQPRVLLKARQQLTLGIEERHAKFGGRRDRACRRDAPLAALWVDPHAEHRTARASPFDAAAAKLLRQLGVDPHELLQIVGVETHAEREASSDVGACLGGRVELYVLGFEAEAQCMLELRWRCNLHAHPQLLDDEQAASERVGLARDRVHRRRWKGSFDGQQGAPRTLR